MDSDHARSIIHIDIDCFYAQVEMNKNPAYKDVPLGVQQKHLVVTSNYRARELGVKKCMSVTEATRICPTLVLVNGEDLHDYRQVSYKLTTLLQQFAKGAPVERLGLDENYVDVTRLVEERLPSISGAAGHVFGAASSLECDCGCQERLSTASAISLEMRDLIYKELKLTTSAGIAHNKLLAKLAGAKHKPNQQTVVFPNRTLELMLSLGKISDIPGMGQFTCQQLNSNGIDSVAELQETEMQTLVNLFGAEKARLFRALSLGIDKSAVKSSGKPQSIGIEDACRTITAETEVRDKLQQLLVRLLILVNEDGRIPKTIKLTVRKLDNGVSHRETRQCNIPSNVFTKSDLSQEKIMSVVMHLFQKISVDAKKPFHVTLLGLSITKFHSPINVKNSLVKFLKKDLEVQSVTNIKNLNSSNGAVETAIPSTSKYIPHVPGGLESPTPSPKKLKLASQSTNMKKRTFEELFDDCESPSKLRVADLSLECVACPPDYDKNVFNELPQDLQKELWDDYERRRKTEVNFCGNQVNKKSKPNTLFNYFVKN